MEDAILSHPSVKEVAAFAHPHTLLGEVVACAVVSTEGAKLSLDDLVLHIRGRLAEHMLPHKAIAVTSIPKGPTGKVQRTFLMQQLGLAPSAAASAQGQGETAGAPQPLSSVDHTSKVEAVVVQLLEALKHVWADVVQRDDPPNLHDDFVARGGNSLAAAIFAARVTKQLHKLALLASGRSLSAVSVMSLRTPHRLAQHILATGGDAAYENHSSTYGGDSLHSENATFALGSKTQEALTVFQQNFFMYQQLYPDSTALNGSVQIELMGPCEPYAARAALHALVSRHSILRTVYHFDGMQYLQMVLPVGEFECPLADRLEALGKPFDLLHAPPLRAALVTTSDSNVLVLELHHLVYDATTLAVVRAELRELLSCLISKREPTEPHSPAPQYLSFSRWHVAQDAQRAAEMQEQLNWWVATLDGAPDRLELPLDRPATALLGVCAEAPIYLKAPLVQQLQAVCASERVTLLCGLLAVWAVVLAVVSQQEEVMLGQPTDMRMRYGGEFSHCVGCFINTLPLRLGPIKHIELAPALHATQAALLALMEHAEVSLQSIVRACGARHTAHGPLFQSRLQLLSAELRKEASHHRHRIIFTADIDLSMNLWLESSGGVCGELKYDSAMFVADRVQGFIKQFYWFLHVALSAPKAPFKELPLMDEAERSELVRMSKGVEAQLPTQHVHEMISTQASRHPDAVALECMSSEDEKDVGEWRRVLVDYGTLLTRARLVAARLTSHGVGGGVLVAVLAVKRAEYFAGAGALRSTLRSAVCWLL